ncbi:hypothetical protein OLZ32_38475 [Rhizobium sp. 1AS11]|uniref:hypothetical protein n=1 Tax=Rhizobium acaciae TaxID=2989736 RepID=UPI002222990B|nr:hypothetical protein [Rhizobium acaciae]MCW1414061.1 hypothetical protein [Rhizobium acaciae]MCW1746230.1 hypothetical protein [Rhizobium acaciae]
MRYSELGRSGPKISALGLGVVKRNTEAEAHVQLGAALEPGINFVDAAKLHPSPSRTGTFGGANIGRRQDIALATKVVGRFRPGQQTPYGRVGYTRANLIKSVESWLLQ